MVRRPLTVAAFLLALAMPAAAQNPWTVEAGVLARGTLFDPSLSKTSVVGAGGWAGVYLSPLWMVEADLTYASASGLDGYTSATYVPIHVRLDLLQSYSPSGTLVIGLGVVRNHYGGAFRRSDMGVSGGLGVRTSLPHGFELRLDGTLDLMPSPANRAGNNWNGGVELGLGYLFRR